MNKFFNVTYKSIPVRFQIESFISFPQEPEVNNVKMLVELSKPGDKLPFKKGECVTFRNLGTIKVLKVEVTDIYLTADPYGYIMFSKIIEMTNKGN